MWMWTERLAAARSYGGVALIKDNSGTHVGIYGRVCVCPVIPTAAATREAHVDCGGARSADLSVLDALRYAMPCAMEQRTTLHVAGAVNCTLLAETADGGNAM